MGILIDPPSWSAHGRWWSHLVSDRSVSELHGFAAAQGIPRRGFERDHYDVPSEYYDVLVAAGATPVSPREVVQRLSDSGLRRRKAQAMARRVPGHALLRPRHLEPGDVVAVPAPAGPVPADGLRAGVQRLQSWGLQVRVGDHVLDRHTELGYLAGDDADRAADFTKAWMDPEVSAVMLARGGYGTQRMLDLLDWRRLAEPEPKVLVGFSDVTALHQACAARLGLATVHSHVVTSLGRASEGSAQTLRTTLMQPEPGVDLLAGSEVTTLVGGTGSGVLVGGNLALLAAEIGTPYSRPGRAGIVVLEDVTEDPYRVDRMLTQLIRSGWFDQVTGIVVGQFTDCGPPAAVAATLADRLAPLGVPLVSGFDFGHTQTTATVPLGVSAVLDADRGSLVVSDPPLL